MGLMQLAQPPTASFCHFANTGQEKKSEHRRREGEWGLEAGGERSTGGGGSKGAEKRGRDTERELVRAKKRKKGQDIEEGKEKGESFKKGEEGSAKRNERRKLLERTGK